MISFQFINFCYDDLQFISLISLRQIINRANLSGENPLDLSRRFSEEFLKDMSDIQCLPPTHEPRVSDHIPHIIELIQKVLSSDSYFC